MVLKHRREYNIIYCVPLGGNEDPLLSKSCIGLRRAKFVCNILKYAKMIKVANAFKTFNFTFM